MAKTIDDLRRKALQGFETREGAALESTFADLLRNKFPTDVVEATRKGDRGADLLQKVNAAVGNPAGAVLWEIKRTKAWSGRWPRKAREDQRRSGADIAIICSMSLPPHIDGVGLIDGVWVAHPRYALAIAAALRNGILQLADVYLKEQGRQTKAEKLYRYLIGLNFRHHVEAIVENFQSMREDLDRERAYVIQQWAKRERQIGSVLEATSSMVGDLQGIVGSRQMEMPAIAGYVEAASTSPGPTEPPSG